MNSTPDTLVYMIAGYVAFALVMLIYITSLILRHHRMKRDLSLLRDLENK
jgi:DMSO/TMAO reductase YedYZ heme-binding membrane subunit